MRYLLIALSALISTSALAGAFKDRQKKAHRYRAALTRVEADVRLAFKEAEAQWPPKALYLRAFKADDVVELWAKAKTGGRHVKVRDFAVCARSGVLGPKIRSGDYQVPEGFYFIDRFNPYSSYHLSLGLNYPNAVDRARTPRGVPTGGDIFVHGNCVTIGCLPLLNGPVEHLYVAAVAAKSAGQRRIPVHIFPCRFDTKSCRTALTEAAATNLSLLAFWETISPAYFAFNTTGIPPRVKVTKSGYILK